MKATQTVLTLAITMAFSSCEKMMNCKDKAKACEKSVSVNKVLYNNASTANYVITDAKVNDDCMEVKFGSSGCDSKSWIVELVDSEQINESATPQRSLKLVLTNNEMCTAAIAKTVSFDLTPLRIKGTKNISLSLSGTNKLITYSY